MTKEIIKKMIIEKGYEKIGEGELNDCCFVKYDIDITEIDFNDDRVLINVNGDDVLYLVDLTVEEQYKILKGLC